MTSGKKEILKNALIDEEAVKITHKSGLEIYVVNKDFTETYAVFGTRYGSYDNVFTLDGEEIAVPHGIAHFLEHKMFETEDGSDTFEQFAEIGADANAYTSTDRTAYLFSCTEEFYRAFEILLRMVTTPVFTKRNVEKEQGIIGQEIKMCEDRPTNALHYNLMKALYEKNPVRIPIAGTIDSIAKITPELLYKCYNAFYRMNNMAICVCGNVDADRILDIVGSIIPQNESSCVCFEKPDEDSAVNRKLIEEEAEIAKPLFRIGIKFPEADVDNRAAADILCEALFGECEDFYNGMYESELVSSYHSYFEFSRPASYFEIGGDSFEPDKVYENFVRYTKNILENGVPEQAFERAKRNIYADILGSFDSSESIAEGMFDSFLVGESYIDKAERYRNVTCEEVNTLAFSVLKEERFAMSVVYPRGYKKAEKT